MNKKKIILTCVMVSLLAIAGCFAYVKIQNDQKNKEFEQMKIVFHKNNEIEYGTKDFDVKTLVKDTEHGKIIKYPEVDTWKIGKQTLIFTLENKNMKKDFTFEVVIKDTNKPEITLVKDIIELEEGVEFDALLNIESVKDKADGNLEYVKKVGKKKGVYTVEDSSDTSKEGEYQVKVTAIDFNGNKSTKEFKVIVKKAESIQMPEIPASGNKPSSGEESGVVNPIPDDEKNFIPEYANEVLKLVNAEREKAGLKPLKMDMNLTSASDIRSKELVQKFSHTRPDGSSCFTAVTGGNYFSMGENIAMGYRTPEEVMKGWMNSEGHRKNILSEDFDVIGISVYKDTSGEYTYYWTQIFAGTW